MNVTKKRFSEFTRSFNQDQWAEFVRSEHELQNQLGNTSAQTQIKKTRALKQWCQGRSDRWRKLLNLKHKFFCDGTEIDIENAADTNADNVGEERCQASTDARSSGDGTSDDKMSEARDAKGKSMGENVEEESEMKAVQGSTSESRNTYAKSAPFECEKGEKPVLIMNNSFASDNMTPRNPSCDKDIDRMKELWVHTIGCELFEGKVHEELTAMEMREKLLSVMQKQNLTYVVVVIMSHGGCDEQGDFICGANGAEDKLYLWAIKGALCGGEKCPRFLILQGCRGKICDSGIPTNTVSDPDEEPTVSKPTLRNLVTVFPSQTTYRSYRFVENEIGSWLITAIYRVFMKYYKKMHVADMLTLVNCEMMNKRGWLDEKKITVKTMSEVASFLIQDFYL